MLRELTYNVVIIDDEVDQYEDYQEHINSLLQPEGYFLNCRRAEALDELTDEIIIDSDLFLVDLKFGKADKGPTFINRIREASPTTDILFYSSDSRAIAEQKTKNEFEGIFFAKRDENTNEIVDKIGKLVSKMIRRSNTPIATRGIVLSGVAELDGVIKEIIELLSQVINYDNRRIMLDRCKKVFYDSYKSLPNKIEEHFGCKFYEGVKTWEEVRSSYTEYSLTHLVNSTGFTESSKNHKVLLELYRTCYEKDAQYKDFAQYENLLKIRNVLAHEIEHHNSEGEIYFKKQKDEDVILLTPEHCKDLRIAIMRYYNLFTAFKDSLSG